MFKLKITFDRHNARLKLNYWLLSDPPHFSLLSPFKSWPKDTALFYKPANQWFVVWTHWRCRHCWGGWCWGRLSLKTTQARPWRLLHEAVGVTPASRICDANLAQKADCKLRLEARIIIEDLYCKLGKKLRLQLTLKLNRKVHMKVQSKGLLIKANIWDFGS